ncbi:MAG: ROK family protein [Flexilinea sp.]|nr:ROK family protein [Flexilinea sp.]
MNYAVGVDMGGTAVKTGLFTEEGTLLDKAEMPTNSRLGKDIVFDNIAASVRGLLTKNRIRLSECCFGLGFPAAVDRSGHVEAAVDLHLFDLYPADELSRRLDGMPVAVENDANAAALGEMWQGGGKGCGSLILITLGTGIGSGIVIDKKILRGVHGIAGEIGHIQVDPDEPERCNCGGKGCLDQIASATGIVRHARRFLEKDPGESVLRGKDPLTTKDVADAARAGDRIALESLTYCMSFLGKMIADVSYVIDPELVIIGGGVSKAGDFLLDLIYDQYKRWPKLKNSLVRFSLAKLFGEAGMYGAAYLALENAPKD